MYARAQNLRGVGGAGRIYVIALGEFEYIFKYRHD